jgi:hypothetical protein
MIIFKQESDMKRYRWELSLGAGFLEIFRTPRDTFFYLFQDLAFVPIQVLLVTLIINQLLIVREKRNLLKKLNMVIGVFLSEVGTDLLSLFFTLVPDAQAVKKELVIRTDWSEKHFCEESKRFRQYHFQINIEPDTLMKLKTCLLGKRPFLLGLLQNPNLLEHDTFTDLLLAVFHVTDELVSRHSLVHLPENDLAHLRGDINRAMGFLISEWLDYLKHLKEDYPYLFSLEIRRNPFDPQASLIFR